MAVGFLLAAALFASSIGVYLWLPWARQVLVACCVVGLASMVIDMPYLMRYVVPQVFSEIKTVMAEEGLKGDELESTASVVTAVSVSGIMFFALVWWIVELVYFMRPKVVAAFEGEAEDSR